MRLSVVRQLFFVGATAAVIAAGVLLSGSTQPEVSLLAQTPDCVTDQRLDARSRHREAVVRARVLNGRQTEYRAINSRYATAKELGLGDDNGFEVVMRAEADGYMLFIRDAADPCSSGVFSDQHGVMYDSRPIR